MTLRKIALWGDPTLVRPAEVVDHGDPRLTCLIEDMLDTMADAGGVGLAAPQVHENLRLLIALQIDSDTPPAASKPLVLLNPKLELTDDRQVSGWEGCLSIPGMRGWVQRAERVVYSGLDIHGHILKGEAEGYFARILQHELDHLDGILYPMKLKNLTHMGFEAEIARHHHQQDADHQDERSN